MTVTGSKSALIVRYIFFTVILVSINIGTADVMLQYFESKWDTIERRAADVFLSGYSSVWLPPNAVADSGGYSVGYDVFDRFNFGSPSWRTLYGTEDGYMQMVRELQQAGVRVYQDVILNHNGFRDKNTPGFESAGGYPGFTTTLAEDEYGDFYPYHWEGDYYRRLAGLISIAHDKNHQFIRHPVEEDSANIPNETPDSNNRRLYPDPSAAPGDEVTPSGFNLTNPLGGEPVTENATGLLLRYMRWMNEVVGVDGFRLDAVKHMYPWFFNDFYDAAVHEKGRKDIAGNYTTPFSFGEALDGSFDLLSQYVRKDGYGNRDVLDFPLFFTMNDIFNAGGFGDLRELSNASIDGLDGNYNNGTYGVQFVASHDDFGPSADNPAHAYILSRPGYPLVYFNAYEFGDGRDFPKPGRGDALGGRFGEMIPRLVRIHNEYARGEMKLRWEAADLYIYERSRNLLVGISDRGDAGYREATVYVDIPPGTELRELTGNHEQSADIPSTLTVDSNWQVTLRVPHNNQQRGYVMYGPGNPQGELSIEPVSQVIPADGTDRSLAEQRLADIPVVTTDTITLRLQTSSEVPEDNAIFRLNRGENVTGSMFMGGDFAGFEPFSVRSSRHEGGTGLYEQEIDVSGLAEGYHYVRVAAFINRPSDYPYIYRDFRKVFYLDRQGVEMDVLYPPLEEGTHTIESENYVLRFKNSCGTGNSFYIFFDDEAQSEQVEDYLDRLGNDNRMTRYDRRHWEYHWEDIPSGERTVAIVGFEESGRAELHRWENFYVAVDMPVIADFAGSPTEGISPLEVSFNDLSSGNINSWEWNFGDGNSSTGQNPDYTYEDPGIYTVSLLVSGPGGSNMATKTNYITVYAPPLADFMADTASVYPGEEVQFTDISTGYVTDWEWDFGDGTVSSSVDPIHEYTESGTYTVSLKVSNPYGSHTEKKDNYIVVYEDGTPDYDAEIIDWELPDRIPVGETSIMAITIRNKGYQPWQEGANIFLGAVDNTDELAPPDYWRIGVETDVYYLQTGEFIIQLQPQETGFFTTEWQMIKEGEFWFGEIFSEEVEVYQRTDVNRRIWQLY